MLNFCCLLCCIATEPLNDRMHVGSDCNAGAEMIRAFIVFSNSIVSSDVGIEHMLHFLSVW